MMSQTATYRRAYQSPYAAPLRFGSARRSFIDALPTNDDLSPRFRSATIHGTPMRRVAAFDRPVSGNNAIERVKTMVALGAGGLLGITIGLSICTTVLS